MSEPRRVTIEVDTDTGPMRHTFVGRVAWTLLALVAAGSRGVTPLDRPAPRWSHYVHVLRKAGIDIETVHEPHDGAFPGRHGKYVLQSRVRVIGPETADRAA